jgi:hypothetical protein
MIQVTPRKRILVAVEPADFRKGIDGLACLCRVVLHSDPFSGYHPHHHPLMPLCLYTHGVFIVSIISAVLAALSLDAVHRCRGWRQTGDMAGVGMTSASTSSCSERGYGGEP